MQPVVHVLSFLALVIVFDSRPSFKLDFGWSRKADQPHDGIAVHGHRAILMLQGGCLARLAWRVREIGDPTVYWRLR